jgi:hypothetical protein
MNQIAKPHDAVFPFDYVCLGKATHSIFRVTPIGKRGRVQ